MGPSHQEDPRTGRDRRGDGAGRARGGAGGVPGAVRGGGVSESVAKASRGGICGEQKLGISTIRLRRFGAIRVFATDSDNLRRRGPLRGRRPRRSPRLPGPARPRLGAETCTLHSSGAFCPREVRLEVPARVQSARLESRMHISTSTGPTRPPPPRTAPARTAPRRPRSRTTTPGEKGPVGSRRRSSAWTTYVPLDHLRAVGPLGSRNTVVQPHLSGPSRPRASRHARRRPTMRDALSGRSEGVAGEPPRRPARPIPTSPGSPRDDRPIDPNASDALQHTRRRLERVIAVDLPHPAPPPSPDNPLHHTRQTHSDAR